MQCLVDLKKLCEPKTDDTAKLIHVDPVNLSGIHLVNESFPNLQTPSSACDELATSLQDAQRLLAESSLQQQADGMKSAMEEGYQNVQEVLWDTFSDSLLSYSCPVGTQLDLLEIYAYPDSRLTEAINEMGGHAQRFTRQDGDLSTPAGQRRLYELLQRTQPKHIWMAPNAVCGVPGRTSMVLEAPRLTLSYRQTVRGIASICACVRESMHGRRQEAATFTWSSPSYPGC